MGKEKSRLGIYIWLAILSILIVATILTVIMHEPIPKEPMDFLTANNLSLNCIEYNQKTVLRYNLTCESCGLWFTEGDYCRKHSDIQEDKGCSWGTFVSAKPIEIEIDDTCKQYGLFPMMKLSVNNLYIRI